MKKYYAPDLDAMARRKAVIESGISKKDKALEIIGSFAFFGCCVVLLFVGAMMAIK